MTRSHAEIATPRASRYLQQLCKHFAHKLPVSFDPAEGKIGFPIGDCHLSADGEHLRLDLTSPDGSQMTVLKDVIVRHLLRFAFREDMAIAWQDDRTLPQGSCRTSIAVREFLPLLREQGEHDLVRQDGAEIFV